MHRLQRVSGHLQAAPTAAHDAIRDDAVYIVSAARTPVGSFNGALASVPATALGAAAIKAAVERAGLKPAQVDEVIMGNVLSAGLGQAPARQASLGAGIPNTTDCTTVNKVCSSGIKAACLAAQSIQLGSAHVVVAGGFESMSSVPYYAPGARQGYRMGDVKLVDGMIKDGLWDVYHQYHMGNAGELCAAEMSIPRKEQDEYAVRSYQRAQAAAKRGVFAREIVAVQPTDVKGKATGAAVSTDEEPNKLKLDKVATVGPAFPPRTGTGSITAVNASKLSDGAAAVVLISGRRVKELQLKPLARVVAYADAAQAPEWFTTAPAGAVSKALAQAKLAAEAVEYWEINEAFSVVALANMRLLKLSPDRVNVHGGAVSIGHPLGCSGARIIVSLLSVLQENNAKYGCASICNGGGGATAMILERV